MVITNISMICSFLEGKGKMDSEKRVECLGVRRNTRDCFEEKELVGAKPVCPIRICPEGRVEPALGRRRM